MDCRGNFQCATRTPPADVPPLSEPKDSDKNLTLRERFAEHRENATCTGCHAKLDPLGFALENFDPWVNGGITTKMGGKWMPRGAIP